MAIFRPGPIIAAISGNLGSLNFAASSKTPYIRMRAVRTNPKSPKQLARRAYLPLASHAWSNLSPDDRLVYIRLAQNMPHKNTLGTKGHLNGYQLFTLLTLSRAKYTDQSPNPSQSFAADPPPYLSTLDFTHGGAFLLDALPYPAFPLRILNVYLSRPMRTRPISHFKFWPSMGLYFHFPGPQDIFPQLEQTIGSPAIGEIIGVKLSWMNRWERPSPQSIFQTTVHA